MLRKLLIGIGLSLMTACAMAAEAGRVVFVVGQAQVGARSAALDMPVQEGDALSTGADGYIYMKTVDDGFLILRPNSKARVSAYHIDQKNPANTRVKLELLDGVARSISGLGVKQARQNFRFNTPVAAIGVRGTDFIVYTNQQSSWVSVVSGGVIVSGFAGACKPDGGGPCEGSASRELFAGRLDAMLQVQRGQQVPQLLQNTTVAPELSAPARSDEPVGKAAIGAKGGAASLGELSLDPAKNSALLLAVAAPKAPVVVAPPPVEVVVTPPVVVAPVVPPVVVTPPVVTVPVLPPVIPAPEILWGRWQAVADRPADLAMIAKMNVEANKVQLLVGSYVVARPNNSSFVLPTEGKVSFALTESEVFLSKLSGETLAAKVDNAYLNIDFVARSFTTGLTAANALGKVDMKSSGDVTLQGTLESSLLSSDFVVRGVLGGAKAGEAAYVFKSTGTPDLSAAGVTRWAR